MNIVMQKLPGLDPLLSETGSEYPSMSSIILILGTEFPNVTSLLRPKYTSRTGLWAICAACDTAKMAITMKANPRTLWAVFGRKMGSEWLSTRDAFNKLIYLIVDMLQFRIKAVHQ